MKMNGKNIAKSFYQTITDIIVSARSYSYKAVNFAMVQAYWNIGRLIVEEEQNGKDRAGYGDFLVNELSKKLSKEFGKGFNRTNLWYMKKFYNAFPIPHAVRGELQQKQIPHAVRGESKKRKNSSAIVVYSNNNFIVNESLRPELSWTHYRLLLKVENSDTKKFYIKETVENNWSTRQLERQINSFYFERIKASKNKKPVKSEAKKTANKLLPEDLIKDPYVLEFLNLKKSLHHLEKDIESALIDKLQEFLLELGKGFAFVERQQRISADNENFYIDLVFYNYMLKCFVLIDLKAGRLTHQDIGQMDMYVRMYEDTRKAREDNPTIGIILCSEKNDTVVKYSVLKDNKRLFASKYMLYLPSEKELKAEIKKAKELIESDKRFYNENK